jgi:hypothetical protein
MTASVPTRAATIAGGATVAAAFALMVVHYLGGDSGDPEGWFSAVGFGSPFVGVGCLSLVGHRFGQPGLCLTAGLALIAMSVVSIVLIPLVVAGGFMIGSIRNTTVDVRSLLVPIVLGAALLSAFAMLVFHQDPVTWSTPTGGGSSSNIVTSTEAAISLTVTLTVVMASIVWSAPRGIRSPKP